jgi:chorismate synthase
MRSRIHLLLYRAELRDRKQGTETDRAVKEADAIHAVSGLESGRRERTPSNSDSESLSGAVKGPDSLKK